MLDRDKKVVWHPFSPMKGGYPIKGLEGAEGVYLVDEDGNRILDGISSWWVNTLGHCNPKLIEALTQQARTLEHVIFAGFTHEPAIKISEELIERLAFDGGKVFFSDDGSTAVEVGLKMCIQYWQNRGMEERKRIIALEGAYHGDTFGAMAVGDRGAFTEPFHPYLFDVEFLPFPGSEESEQEAIEIMKLLCEKGDIAGFIFEPMVQGAAGMRIYKAEVLEELMKVAGEHDVLCIADEIFSGFYRTGKFMANEHVLANPDIICLSKGLTAGMLPLSITVASSKIVEVFNTADPKSTFFHGHSFTANPLGCAVALASLRELDSEPLKNSLDKLVRAQGDFVNQIKDHPRLLSARSLGTILSLELDTGSATSYFNDLRNHIYNYFMDRNILLRPLGNVIYFLPPYIITADETDLVHNTIEEFLDSEW